MSLKDFHLVFISIVTLLFLGLTIYTALNEVNVFVTIAFALLTIIAPYYGWKFRSKIKDIDSKL